MAPQRSTQGPIPGATRARAEASRDYIAYGRDWHRPFLDRWLPQSGIVADVGCGQGRVAAFYHRTDRPVMGIDLDRTELAAARSVSWATFVAGDAFRLPLPPECLSGYVGLGIAEFGPRGVLAEAYRVLRPGALLYLSVTHLNLQRRLGQPARWHGVEVHTFSRRQIADLLGEQGFDVRLVRRSSIAWGLGPLRAVSRLFPAALIREDSSSLSYRVLAPALLPIANSILVIAHKRVSGSAQTRR